MKYLLLLAIVVAGGGAFIISSGLSYDTDSAPNNHDAINAKGTISIVKYDPSGSPVYEQTKNNMLLAVGGDYILNQIFQTSATDVVNNAQIGSLCVSTSDITSSEAETASDFDGDNTLTGSNCKQDSDVTTSGQIATIGPLTFLANDVNFPDATTISSVGVCSNVSADANDFTDCASNSKILFAQIEIDDVTVNAGESISITYTFDILPVS